MLVVQDNHFNDSKLATVIVLSLTTNTRLAGFPGNIALKRADSGLSQDSVINVTQIATINKGDCTEKVGEVSQMTLDEIAYGLSLVLGLD